MDALREALAQLQAADSFYDASENGTNAYYRSRAERAYENAGTLAAVAQAQQLRRIADALEVLASRLPHLREYVGPVSEDEDAGSTD